MQIVWACSCGLGGIARPHSGETADDNLEHEAAKHLHANSTNQGHTISHGEIQGRIRVVSRPPLEREEVKTS